MSSSPNEIAPPPTQPWDKQTACANCKFVFEAADNFCPDCGQPNRTHKRPVRFFIRDFFEELLSLDARIFDTLRDLILKPGKLTKNYNADMRMRYSSPLRVYVLSSVLFFLTVSWLTNSSIREVSESLSEDLQQNDSLFADMNLTLIGLHLEPEDLQAIQDLDVHSHGAIDSLLTARGKKSGWLNVRALVGLEPFFTGRFSLAQYYQNVLKNLSYSLFFFMPVMALLFKLLYIRRHQFYTEHLIFSIHFHTFAFLFVTACLWLDQLQDFVPFSELSFLGVLIYMSVAMKVVYEQGWFKTLLKGTVAFWSYVFFVLLSFSFLLLLSLF